MSYILDALKRAESERSRGAVPGLHAQPATTSLSTSNGGTERWVPAGVGAVTVLTLAAVGWWGWSVFKPVTGTGVPQVAVAPSIAPTGVQSPLPGLVPTVEPALQPKNVTVAAVAVPAAVGPLGSLPVATERPLAPGAASQQSRSAAKVDTEVRLPAASASAPSTGERVYTLAELPGDIRSQLPSLTVGGATYSESPASRMLILNGQLYHEGDKLAPELTLQQIQLRRAVLSFRGYRYTLSY